MDAAKAPGKRTQFKVGTNLGRYRVLAHLGSGGMGDVFLVAATGPHNFHKLVVVKMLRPELHENQELVAMFLHEAELAARLSHPNVIDTYEVGELGEHYGIVMEYVEGQSLARIRREHRDRPMPLWVSLSVLAEALRGLHYAHEARDFDGRPLALVHRDATPANILVSYEGRVKLVDFGIAKAANSDQRTATGIIKGTIRYMAPERLTDGGVDRRLDIYSAGVILWESLTNRSLFGSSEPVVMMSKLSQGLIPSVEEANPEAPPELIRITKRAMALEQSDRYGTALAMAEELETYLRAHPGPQTLGEYVVELFAEERARITKVVQEQLARLRESTTSVEIPQLDAASAGSRASSQQMIPIDLSGLATVHAGSNSKPIAIAPELPRRGFPRPVLVATALALALVSLGTLALVLASEGPPPALGSTPMAAAATKASAPRLADRLPTIVTLEVRATPLDSDVRLDGLPLTGRPPQLQVPASDRRRQLAIRAEGHAPQQLDVVLDRDRRLDITLDPARRAPRAARRGRSIDRIAPRPAAPPGPVDELPEPRPTTTDPVTTRPTRDDGLESWDGTASEPRRRPGLDSENPYK